MLSVSPLTRRYTLLFKDSLLRGNLFLKINRYLWRTCCARDTHDLNLITTWCYSFFILITVDFLWTASERESWLLYTIRITQSSWTSVQHNDESAPGHDKTQLKYYNDTYPWINHTGTPHVVELCGSNRTSVLITPTGKSNSLIQTQPPTSNILGD